MAIDTRLWRATLRRPIVPWGPARSQRLRHRRVQSWVPAAARVSLLALLWVTPAMAAEPSSRGTDPMSHLARRLADGDGRPVLPNRPVAPSIPPSPAAPSLPQAPASPREPTDPSAQRAASLDAASRLAPSVIARRENLPLRMDEAAGAADYAPVERRDTLAAGWVRTFGALTLVIGLIFVARAAVRRLNPGAASPTRLGGALQVLGRTSVGPKQAVMLMRVGQRILVVGDSAGTMRTLAEVTEPEEVADLLAEVSRAQVGSATRAFEQMLGRMDRNYDREDGPTLEGVDEAEIHTDRAREQLGGLLSRLRNLVRQPLGGPQTGPVAPHGDATRVPTSRSREIRA